MFYGFYSGGLEAESFWDTTVYNTRVPREKTETIGKYTYGFCFLYIYIYK